VIGALRYAGILIIAIWLGAVVFFLVGAGPAAFSSKMEQLLGAKNHPYYSAAIAQIIDERLFYVGSACSAAAVLHLVATWLYVGRVASKPWLALLAVLTILNLGQGAVLQPKLRALHLTAHAVNVPASARDQARESFRNWSRTATGLDLVLVLGLAVYLWRVANPADPTRFVSAVKFRS
jgi:hypothetical protein